MADLQVAFAKAAGHLAGASLRKTKTQEVLELKGVQGIAWRALENPKVFQIYPRAPRWNVRRENGLLILDLENNLCEYADPAEHLRTDVWFYVGCRDCSLLPNNVIDGWLAAAYRHLRAHKGLPPP